MQWSPQQETGLQSVKKWFAAEDPLFKLFGFAGTGKTTLAMEIAQMVGGNVLFAAYTGKAAYVLQQKGCHGASTIHSLIYHTADKSKAVLQEMKAEMAQLVVEIQEAKGNVGKDPRVIKLKRMIDKEEDELSKPFFRINHDSPVKQADLVIIDECSMVGKQMGQDLLDFGTPILVLGDPAQLPPVGDGGFFTLGKPHHMLTEIHRQAKDNPIIHLATRIRKGEGIALGHYGESRVIKRDELNHHLALSADQLLVGRNDTRRSCNTRLRELYQIKSPLPVENDKLVCLRNNYDEGFLNGSLWRVTQALPDYVTEDYVEITVVPHEQRENHNGIETIAHRGIFEGNELKMPWWDRKTADEFDYGYALTCHKAQGSQWDNVLVFDESAVFKQNRSNWLYTAVTRAAEKVTIVKGY